jgi:hypothetical protein
MPISHSVSTGSFQPYNNFLFQECDCGPTHEGKSSSDLFLSNQIKSFIHHQLDIYNMHECSEIITSYSGNFLPDTYIAFNPANFDCVEKAEHNH